ncbi:MAG: GGDEF domain-containing protein [Rhodocyclaceae bacterium]|nr:GGDEF domain-containing protein [Rhodocyclaceae bacterium]MBX3670067.1 GGDEF domain-containing protein [Rhodocyclaceae bacterium]
MVSRALRYALERHRREAEIRYLATHDSLTTLFNRSFFNQYLEKALERSARHSARLGLLFVDLDKFKPINDEYGHEAGDAVLKEVASRLLAAVRKSDLVARLGGDEFVVLLEDIRDVGDLHEIGNKLLTALRADIALTVARVAVTPSIGMAVHPRAGGPEHIRAGDLLKQADHAMYQAKANGKNTLVEYRENA